MKRLVLGILAHVDAGKTTLSEAMLYQTGTLRKLGRVDHGNTFLDTDTIEKARGITIFSKEALLQIGDASITLLDTPGHVDFSAEMERTLSALDYAVLVISGTDGVQSHTETLWKLLAHYHIPTFLFINKMDLPIASKAALFADIQKRLSPNCVDFTAAPCVQEAIAEQSGGITAVQPEQLAQWEEELSLCDEALMEQALSGQPLVQESVCAAVANRQVFPCFFGAALKLEGVQELLAGLAAYTAQPSAGQAFAARVFKITEDATGARLVWVKVMGGTLAAKTGLESRPEAKEAWREKVDQIRLYSGDKYTQTEVLYPGMAAAVTGLSTCQIGEGLGAAKSAPTPLLEPVLNYTVKVPEGTDTHTVLRALQTIAGEDPQLRVQFQSALGEIHLQLMGEVQLEVMQSVLQERFGLVVTFGQGRILYKESITQAVEGIGHYEPLRHYAETHLVLEPLPQGSGIQLESTCHVDALNRNWQNLILTHLAEKTHLGVLTGSPLTDVKITLIAGRAHLKHTEGGDFRQATYRAVRHALRCTESTLLEPWYHFQLEVPAEQIGRAMADVQKMAGEFSPPELGEEIAVLIGSAPVSTMRTYAAELTSYTRGRGRISLTLQGYAPCHDAAQVIEAIAYDPDMDTENPAGSVFCSHGAGYFVPWEEVKAHAHIDTEWGKVVAEEFVPKAAPRRAAQYSGTLAQDKELLAIFEKTYGKINRDAHRAFTPPKKAAPAPKVTSAPIPAGPEYLLVDGYNVLHAWDDLAKLAEENLETARQRLMDMLCNYQGFRKVKVILVFDAYKVKGNLGSVLQYHGIQVVYTKEAETADSYIERATHDMAKQHRVRVVSSDGAMQYIILGNGALRVSARTFRQELDATEKEIRAYLER
ncbi:MAG: translation factor GTPase family protein [Faecalibacterium sp.]